ncbi:MAG: dihydrodipicolinate synthase family protein [Cyclobacteriaceae bacterium]
MKKKHIEGLIAAPFTPMNHDGSVNIRLIPAYYQMLKRNGVRGAFICGSTGEGVSLTMDEKKEIAKAWGSCAEDDVDFSLIMFLGGNCLADSKELALHAKDCNFRAVSFTAPSYFKPANVTLLASMCEEIAEVVPEMLFYYYHIPVLTGVNFPMLSLLQSIHWSIPNFAGIKYTHEDFMDFLSCMHFADGKYDMLWGRDESMLPALSLGVKGVVGSTYNYVAPLYHQLIDAFNDNDLQEASRLQQVSIDLIGLLGKYGGMGTGKAYMKLIGLDCGEFRLPVSNMTNKQFEAFKADADQLNFQAFSCS